MRSGEYIMRERLRKNWSYRELAQKAGVSHSLISKWEKNELIPYPEKAQQVVEALELDWNKIRPILESELAREQAEKDLLKAKTLRAVALQTLRTQEWLRLLRETLMILDLRQKGMVAPPLHAAASISLLRDDRKDTRVEIKQGPFVTADGRLIFVARLLGDTENLVGRRIVVERNEVTLWETTIGAPDAPIELGQNVDVPVDALPEDEKEMLDQVGMVDLEPSVLTFKLF